MAQFYFDLCNGEGLVVDEEGQEFPGLEDALAEARAASRALIAAEIAEGRPVDLTHHITVRDGNRVAVGKVVFQETVQITGIGARS